MPSMADGPGPPSSRIPSGYDDSMKTVLLSLALIFQPYSALTLSLSAQDQPKLKEPERVGEFCFLDSLGEIRPPERQKPKGLTIKGDRSPIRFVQGESLAFVVRLSSQDIDPATLFQFFQLNAHGENRVAEIIIGGRKKDIRYAGAVPFEATKYGEGSFKMKIES